MKPKSVVHEAFSLLFQWDGVPPAIICDSSKDMILGELKRKLKEASCYIRQTKPFTPWLNAAEIEINELKKGSNKKFI